LPRERQRYGRALVTAAYLKYAPRGFVAHRDATLHRRRAREANPGEYERKEIEASNRVPWRFVASGAERVARREGLPPPRP